MDSIVPVQIKNFSGDGKEVYGNCSCHVKCQKSFTLTIRWNFAHLVKIYHGIIVLLHFIDLGRMVLPKEQCAE